MPPATCRHADGLRDAVLAALAAVPVERLCTVEVENPQPRGFARRDADASVRPLRPPLRDEAGVGARHRLPREKARVLPSLLFFALLTRPASADEVIVDLVQRMHAQPGCGALKRPLFHHVACLPLAGETGGGPLSPPPYGGSARVRQGRSFITSASPAGKRACQKG